jgi:hypothetical protein
MFDLERGWGVMVVYVAQAHYEYEGFDILGIFTTEEAAWKCLKDAKEKDRFAFDFCQVETSEVQGEV